MKTTNGARVIVLATAIVLLGRCDATAQETPHGFVRVPAPRTPAAHFGTFNAGVVPPPTLPPRVEALDAVPPRIVVRKKLTDVKVKPGTLDPPAPPRAHKPGEIIPPTKVRTVPVR